MEMRQARSSTQCAKWGLLILCLLAMVMIAASHPTQESQDSDSTIATPTPTPVHQPSIFDFKNYVRLFKRVYKSKVEAMVRFYYFSARAIRVFVAAVKYRHGEQLYYLGINWLSDATPEELEKMENKVLGMETGARAKEDEATPVDNVNSADPADGIEADLRQLADENQDDPAFKELGNFLDGSSGQKVRKKRDAQGRWRKRRHLPMEKLISTGSDFKLDPEVRAKMRRKVPSNNPAYKPIELTSRGLVDEQTKVGGFMRLKPLTGLVRVKGVLHRLDDLFADDGSLKSTNDQGGAANKEHFYDASDGDFEDDNESDDYAEGPPDEVFLDLRETTKCFLPPRNQGDCGSCYAFSATTLAEWHYCMETNVLVPFSEQYMIDCGNKYVEGVFGCAGAKFGATATFFHNFGLELEAHYPYAKRNGSCPYREDEPLKTTGYIRTDMPDYFQVSLKEVPNLLKFGPMLVIIKTDPTFHQYSGGVLAIPCVIQKEGPEGVFHATVLVGHGRENGREYWLIRNSYGVGWGEGGYYKLDKTVGGICHGVAYLYGTRDGLDAKINARANPDNPAGRVRKLKAVSK